MNLKSRSKLLITVIGLSTGLVACGTHSENDIIDNSEPGEIVSSASISADPEDLVAVLTHGANWLFIAEGNIELDKDLYVQGELRDTEGQIARKLGLLAREEDKDQLGEIDMNILEEYTLTVPNMIVQSPNFIIQSGVINGNVMVEAKGFEMRSTNITGDLIFASQELMEDAIFDETLITGDIKLAE